MEIDAGSAVGVSIKPHRILFVCLPILSIGHGYGIKPVHHDSNVTTHPIEHMETEHRINADGAISGEATAKATQLPSKPVNFFLYRERLVTFVVLDNISFRAASSVYLLDLLDLLHPGAAEVHPASHSTVAIWVEEDAQLMRERIRSALHTAITKISLSLDIWTSPNYYSFLGIEAHFIDHNGKLWNLLIAFRVIYGPHTGVAISQIVHAVCEFYGILNLIGYSTMDNASNNNTFAQDFYEVKLDKHGGWKYWRLRCGCHILNLAMQYSLYGSKAKKRTTHALGSEAVEAAWNEEENEGAIAAAASLHIAHVEEKAHE